MNGQQEALCKSPDVLMWNYPSPDCQTISEHWWRLDYLWQNYDASKFHEKTPYSWPHLSHVVHINPNLLITFHPQGLKSTSANFFMDRIKALGGVCSNTTPGKSQISNFKTTWLTSCGTWPGSARDFFVGLGKMNKSTKFHVSTQKFAYGPGPKNQPADTHPLQNQKKA